MHYVKVMIMNLQQILKELVERGWLHLRILMKKEIRLVRIKNT